MIWLGLFLVIGFVATAVAIHAAVCVAREERSQKRANVLLSGGRDEVSQLEQLMLVSQALASLSKNINANLVNEWNSVVSAEEQSDFFDYAGDRAFQESVTSAPGGVNRIEAFLRASSK